MNSDKLLSVWISRLLTEHFKKQKKDNTEKLFIKISGLTRSNIESLLEELRLHMTSFRTYYEPIIRTIKKVDQYEEFSYQENETSTWLRNNTKTNQALLLIINENTPEAQSLENLFTIDESYLLSNSGLEPLYNVLSEKGLVAADEIEFLKVFMDMYNHISEPQLRNILSFLVEILKDPNPSVIDKIQNNLPYLNLFKDSKLKIDIKERNRLYKNFQLANLQITQKERENIQNNLYSFLEQEEKNGWTDEVWEEKNPEQLTDEMVSFLDQSSNDFLFNDFEFVKKITDFKIKPPTVKEEIEILLENNRSDLTDDEIKNFENGLDEVVNGQDPDAIQEFIDDFETILDTKSGLVKKLNRVVEKLRNPSIYSDLTQGILKEIFSLIEDSRENHDISSSKFQLEILTSKTNENISELLKLFLKNIQIVMPRISFKEESIPEVSDDTKEYDVSFEIKHLINGEIEGVKKFKVTSFNELETYTFFEKIEKGILPYTKNFAENEIEQIDVISWSRERVKNYLVSNQYSMNEHLNRLENFLTNYVKKLQYARDFGIFALESQQLEKELDDLLSNIYFSTQVSQHIYQNINFIGAVDYYESRKGETGIPVIRKLTIFNPIRLIAYIRRCEELNLLIEDWLHYAAEGTLEVEKLEEYLEFIRSKTKNLAPRYFSSYGDQSFLIENSEIFGEGTFVLNTKPPTSLDYLANELSEELVRTTKNYLEVYPYASDGMDILMLYCQSVEVVMKCVDSLFSKTKLKKLRLTIHSTNSAILHNKLNKWLEQKEDYIKPEIHSKFPKLEINVISGNSNNEIFHQIEKKMIDCDLVVLADYFSQGNQINYLLERVKPIDTESWFETIYKEPLKDDEAVKRISYVSEHLPKLLQNYYQLQYIIQSNVMPPRDEINTLKNLISINNINQSTLIDKMHVKFNWTMILDRYLDKTLLTKTSAEANIIQYKPKVGKNSEFKLMVSSSKYIRKISEQVSDYAYYDRLHRKLVSIMKNENISRDVMVDAVNKVKDISGALVLKVIGRGKYAHEMIATYLTTNRREQHSSNKLQVWSLCDDLPWFANNKRRPDLVLTTIEKDNDQIFVDFELVELKFVNHNIFDKERFDALKQIKSGISLYHNLFNFNNEQLDTDFWRSELIQYFIEKSSYSPEHAQLLKEFQHTDLDNIKVNIHGSVDVYCYTSNLIEYNFNKEEDGVFVDKLDSNIENKIFSRSYILNELKASEEETPNYDDVVSEQSDQDLLKLTLQPHEESDEQDNVKVTSGIEIEVENVSTSDNEDTGQTVTDPPADDENKVNDGDTVTGNEVEQKGWASEENENRIDEGHNEEPNEQVEVPNHQYPEVIALKGLELSYETEDDSSEQLRDLYIRKLKHNFNQNGIHLNIKEAIVGSSVIRFELDLPADLPANKVLSRSKDIQIWLGLSTEPHIFISKGMKIDIIREEPETIYFEKFMELVRDQLRNKITETNLIAPLGLDPLNNVLFMDFSNSMSPHLLTGGTTGSGKSVTLNSIILGMMCIYSPEQVQFLFIDPKKVEFTIYQNKAHTRQVITELQEAVDVLQFYVNEMEDRYTKFAQEGVTNLDEYITEVGEKLPRVVIVFDEFADFMTQDPDMKKQVENAIMRLGQKARAAGIHLIICTQNPKADIINTNIRNNLGARLALRASDANASNVILDESGAEKLAGKGDFLAKLYGNIERGKSPFLTTKVRRALLKYFNID